MSWRRPRRSPRAPARPSPPASSNTFTVSATGSPLPGFGETGSLPSGVSLVDNGNGTATLSGTPAQGSGGVYPITLIATNGYVPSATQSFTLTVDESPSIASANSQTFIAGTPTSFTVQAYGYPKPSIAVSGTLPPGVSFVDNGNGTGTLSGSASSASNSSYPLTIMATSGGTHATQELHALRGPSAHRAGIGHSDGNHRRGAGRHHGDRGGLRWQPSDLHRAVRGRCFHQRQLLGESSHGAARLRATPGPYSVSVQVSDPAGATAQATTTVSVDQGQPLVANAGPDSPRR